MGRATDMKYQIGEEHASSGILSSLGRCNPGASWIAGHRYDLTVDLAKNISSYDQVSEAEFRRDPERRVVACRERC